MTNGCSNRLERMVNLASLDRLERRSQWLLSCWETCCPGGEIRGTRAFDFCISHKQSFVVAKRYPIEQSNVQFYHKMRLTF